MKEHTTVNTPKIDTRHVRAARAAAAARGIAVTDLVRVLMRRISEDPQFAKEFVEYASTPN